MMSVLSYTPRSLSDLITSPRFLSLDSIPATALDAPTPTSCCDLSGSLNQSSVYLGRVFFHKTRSNERVVQLSCAVLGWVTLVGQALSSFTFTRASPMLRGMVLPSNRSTDSFSASESFLFDRSCSSTTAFDPAMTVEI